MKYIKLTQNQFAIVDNKNYEQLSKHKWSAQWCKETLSFYVTNTKHVGTKVNTTYMHREVLGLKRGDRRQADHINHNTLDNRKCNLRIVTNQENHFNRRNTKGYFWSKSTGKYKAYITINRKQIHLGYHNTSKKARQAYLKAKKEYHKIGDGN